MSDQIDTSIPADFRRRRWWGVAASLFIGGALLVGLTISLRAQQSPAQYGGYSPQSRDASVAEDTPAGDPYAVFPESSLAIAATTQDRNAPQSTAASSSGAATLPSQNVRAGGEVYGFAYPQTPLSTRQGEVLAEQLVTQLVQQLLQRPAGDRDPETLGRLRELVEKQFDVRHEAQVARLERVLADAKKAQEILDRRAEHKEEIVERRIAELLGQSDPLNWDYPAAGPTTARVPNSSQAPASTYQIPVYSSPIYPPQLPATAPIQTQSLPRMEFTPQAMGARPSLSQPSAPTVDAAQNQDWIDTVFQYQNAQSQLAQRTQQLGKDHPELKGLQTNLAQAATRLELSVTDLRSQLEIANARLESARGQEELLVEQFAEIESMYKNGLVKRSETLEIQQQLFAARERRQRTEIELRLLKSQLEWMEKTANASNEQPQTTDEIPAETGEKPSVDQ